MIIVAKTQEQKLSALRCFQERGVPLTLTDDFQAIARLSDNDERLMGIVAYNNFCGKICSMHIVGDGNWVSREFIRIAFDYPFNQCGLKAILSPIASNNTKALKFDLHFGFQEVHRVKDGWEQGVDLILLQLLKEECRYLGKESHEELSAKAA
jgi:RimJ/RimL family protein N-acetyltransferase